jgi:glycosyltransferase involved in cell wall biosynthesis
VSRGLPFTSLLTAGYDWAGAVARARAEAGPFDATVVLLSRLDPWVRRFVEGRSILDAIDSLEKNAEERSRASSLSAWLWRHEAARIRRAERDASIAYDEVLVVSDDEAPELNARTIPSGVEIGPLHSDQQRAFDFAFWGRLAYFANADAVRLLLREIWPAIRRLAPTATLAIGGASAPADLAREAVAPGVTFVSPVPDMPAFARNAKIALLPIRYGTGQGSKPVEAAEAGCAIAATPHALRDLAPLRAHAVLTDDAQELAVAAVSLLRDSARLATNAKALRHAVETHYARERTHERLRDVVQARGAA